VEGVFFAVAVEVEMLPDAGGADMAEAGKAVQRQAGLAVAPVVELAPGAGDRALAAWAGKAGREKSSKVYNVPPL
jgi:hypothetical protein